MSQKSLSASYPPYSSVFEVESSDTLSPGSRPLLPSINPFVVSEPPQPPCSKPKRLLKSTQRLAVETWRDVVRDSRSARWGRGGLWFLFSIWASGLLVALIMVPLFGATSSQSACKPDGSFSVLDQYDAWNINGFFQITVTAFAQLTFSEAKLIDVVWDIGLGRIGQIILILFSWKAFALHIMSEMEDDEGLSVTYDTYWTFFMARESNLITIFSLVHDFVVRKGFRSKITMTITVLTMVFVMSWPTIASAMTGYDSNNTGFINLTDSTQVPFSAFQPILYVIHDGSRVGLSDEYLVAYCNGTYDGDPIAYSEVNTGYEGCSTGSSYYDYDQTEHLERDFQYNVSNYVEIYGFYGLNNTASHWAYSNMSLSAPVLNISAFYIDGGSKYYGYRWEDDAGTMPFSNWSNMAYTYNNETYRLTYIEDNNGLCQPGGTYKWGFSFLQVFIALCLMAIWTLAIWVVWLRAHIRLSHRGPYEIPTRYQAAMRLNKAIEEEFEEHGKPIHMSNKDFTNCRSKALKGGAVRHYSDRTATESRGGMWSKTKKWLRKERWWCTALTIHSLWLTVGWLLFIVEIFYFVTLWAWPSVVFALSIGTTRRSRLFFIGSWVAIGLVVIIPLFNPGRYY